MAAFRVVLTFAFLACGIGGWHAGAQQVSDNSAHREAGQASSQTASGASFMPFRQVPQQVVAPAALAERLAREPRSAISVATGNFFEDGHTGLITGYALGEGGVIGIQQGLTLPRAEEAGTASGFAENTTFVDVTVRPDLLRSIDFGFGHKDLAIAARGGRSVEIFQGDGRGGFAAQTPISVGGAIESLVTLRGVDGRPLIAAGVCAAAGCAVEIYGADGAQVARIAVEGKPSLLEAAMVNQTGTDDLIAGGERSLVVIDGRTIAAARPRIDRLPVTGAVAIAIGNFVYDRRGMRQIGVLSGDGTIHTLARVGVDPVHPKPTGIPKHIVNTTPFVNKDPLPETLAWTDYEQLPGVAAPTQRVTPLLLRSRVNGFGMDDLVVLNVNGGKTTTIAHPVVGVQGTNGQPGETRVLPARVDTEAKVSGDILAAVATRVTQDARFGLIAADANARPEIAQQPTYRVFTVNSTSDGAPNAAFCNAGNNGTCTLRSAIAAANADLSADGTSKADTINIPGPGPYTLTYNSGLDDQGSITYHIEIIAPVNIIGTGSAPTITTNNKDKIFSLNSTANNNPEAPIDVYFSNLILTNGTNLNNYYVQGNSNDTGGLLDADTDGSGNFTFVNCTFSNGTVEYSNGGGLYVSDGVYNGTHGPGVLEIDGSMITGNRTPEQGGGISTATSAGSGNVPILLNGDTFTSNVSSYQVNTGDQYGTGQGGGLFFSPDPLSGVLSKIENTIFTNNSSVNDAQGDASDGGGAHLGTGLTMTNVRFDHNTTGGLGGGIKLETYYQAATLTGMTFTGNTAGQSGGAMDVQAEGTANSKMTTLQYSRITGNTAPASKGSAIYYGVSGDTDPNATFNAYPNFWGCNGEPNSTGCDTVVYTGAGGTLNTTGASQAGSLNVYPYVAVTASLSSTAVFVGSAVTLYGNLNTTSTGTFITGTNLAAFSNVAGTGSSFTTAGTAYTSTAPPGTAAANLTITENSSNLASGTPSLNASGQASLSVTPTAGGSGTGVVKIDNATVTLNYTVSVSPPMGSSSFTPSTVSIGGTSILAFTLSNPNPSGSVTLTGVAFSETLPAGLQVAASPGVSNSCGGTVTAAANGTTVGLSGGTINAGSICTLYFSVTATTAGTKTNSTGSITASNASSNGAAATAVLTVDSPITATQGFSPSSIRAGGTSTVTFTVSNSNSAAQTALTFADTLPNGMTVASPNGVTSTCGGTLTATAGSNSISIGGGSVSGAGTCAFSVNVADSTAGSANNNGATLSSSPGGTGSVAAATLTVVSPPTISESFAPASVAPNANSTVTFTLNNPAANTVSQTGVAFSDTLPSGLSVSTPSGVSTSCTSGVVTAAAGGSSISLSGATLATNASCTVSVNVVSPSIGSYPNTTGAVSSTNGGTGTGTSATLTVTVTPTKVVYTVPPAMTLTAGGNAGTVTVALADANTNYATNNNGTPVALAVTGPNGYSQIYSGTTSNGTVSYNLSPALLTAAGTYTYTASATGLSSATASQTVNPGSAAALTVAGLITATAPGQAQPAVVKAIDSFGNTVTGFTGTVTLTGTDALAIYSPASYTYTASDAGVHAFAVTLGTAGSQTVTATSGSLTGSQAAIQVLDAILVVNPGGSLSRLTDAGVATSPSSGYTGGGAPTIGAAIDSNGNIFSLNTTGNVLLEYAKSGVNLYNNLSGGGLNAPVALAIDGLGQVWIANGNGTVSVFSNSGIALSPTAGYPVGGTKTSGIAIDISGNVWVANANNSTVTEILGGAAPAAPLAIAVANVQLGSRP